ncbi:MAG: hypothetical protein ACLFUR_05835 [Candidatus Hadarchaeia archaeon]
MLWRKSEVKELKLEMKGSLNISRDALVERMSNRLGMDMDSIRRKISEIKGNDK